MNLLRAELLKLRTTSLWWIFGIILLPLWTITLLLNWVSANALKDLDPEEAGVSGTEAEQFNAAGEAINIATNLYTSGQFFGILLVLLLGAILVTNEFFHLTATTTFLTTPHRERVILAKVGAAVLAALLVWGVTTALNLAFAPLILDAVGLPAQLGEGAVWRAIGLNALAFALWAVVGVGFGVLIRSQIAATVVLSLVYVLGTAAVGILWPLLVQALGDWVWEWQVIIPTSASSLLISGTELPGSPPRWVGGAVLIGYAAVAGIFGTAIMKRRDIG